MLSSGRLALPAGCPAALSQVRTLGVRPEHWQLMPPGAARGLQARVERVEWLGDVTLVHCRLGGASAADTISVKTALADASALPHGTPVRLRVQPRDMMLFDARGRALAA